MIIVQWVSGKETRHCLFFHQILRKDDTAVQPAGKGRFQKRFSGIRPLRGGGVPPLSAKEKNLLFLRLIFR